MPSFYVPSTTPGKSWNVYVHKPAGRPAYACAVEGVVKTHPIGAQSFETVLFQDRTRMVDLPGNNTIKNRAIALDTLRTEMIAAGEIDQHTPAFPV